MAVSLKVHEAYKDDIGRGVVRVDYEIMDSLVPSKGNPLDLENQRAVQVRNPKGAGTYAKCVPLYPSDEGKGMARLDDITGGNAGVNLGDTVELTKVKLYKAEVVSVVNVEPTPPLSDGYLTEAMESIVIKGDDKIRIPYFGGRLTFKIVKILPAPRIERVAAICTLSTKFILSEQYHGSTTIG